MSNGGGEEAVIVIDDEINNIQEEHYNEKYDTKPIQAQINALHHQIESNRKSIIQLQKENVNLNAKIQALESRQLEIMMKKGIDESNSESFKSEPLEQATRILREVFKLKEWRSPQKEIINAVLMKRDVMVIMPAGSGKSLTYQLPVLLLDPGKVFFVISPLLALMIDQIEHLQKIGIRSVMISSVSSKEDNISVWEELFHQGKSKSNPIRLVYVTPEFLARSKKMRSSISKLNSQGKVGMLVVDEAHCCSQWGHEFRPDYRKLNSLRMLCRDVPIMALTATAPHSVRKDIVSLLQLKDPILFFKSVRRENLLYSIQEKKSPSDATAAIGQLISTKFSNASGLVYCLQKKETEQVATILTKEYGVTAEAFHADVSNSAREARYRRWYSGSTKVMVATVAFGMGIHKEDVRFVIHHTMSKSLSAYYQESGRAGRDGKPSDCILFYSPFDAARIACLSCSEIGGMEQLKSMIRYCQEKRLCRNSLIAEHFEERLWSEHSDESPNQTSEVLRCGSHCDNCLNFSDLTEEIELDITSSCHSILRAIQKDQTCKKTMLQWEKELPGIDSSFKALGKNQRGLVLLEMFLQRALDFHFIENAYGVNAYLTRGDGSLDHPVTVSPQKKTPRRKSLSNGRKKLNPEDEEEEFDYEDDDLDFEPKDPQTEETSEKTHVNGKKRKLLSDEDDAENFKLGMSSKKVSGRRKDSGTRRHSRGRKSSSRGNRKGRKRQETSEDDDIDNFDYSIAQASCPNENFDHSLEQASSSRRKLSGFPSDAEIEEGGEDEEELVITNKSRKSRRNFIED